MPVVLPKPTGRCGARKSTPPGEPCPYRANEKGAGYFCGIHRRSLLADPEWPLVEGLERYREALLQRLRATGDADERRASRALEHLVAMLLEPKVVGGAVIVVAAFLSQYLFLKPFGIDFSFFLGTIDSVALFVTNVSHLLLFCLAMCLALASAIVLIVTGASIAAGSGGVMAEMKREERRKLAEVRADIAGIEQAGRENESRRQQILVRLGEIHASLESLGKPDAVTPLTRLVRRAVTALVDKASAGLGRTRRRADVDEAARQREQKLRIEREKQELEAERKRLDMELVTLSRQRRAIDDSRQRRKRDADRLRNKLEWPVNTFLMTAVDNFRQQLAARFKGKLGLTILDRPRWQWSLAAIVLVVPLLFSYLDGLTMVNCARSLTADSATATRTACPTDGRAAWGGPPGSGDSRVVDGPARTMATATASVAPGTDPDRPGAAGGSPTHSAADAVRGLFSWLRAIPMLARNYPVVSVAVNGIPDMRLSGPLPTGAREECRMVATPRPADPPAGRREPASAAVDAHCILVTGGVTARLVYLGEAGNWTLLHGIGPEGGPMFLRTNQIKAVSVDPVVTPAPATGDTKSQPPVLLVSIVDHARSDLVEEIHGVRTGLDEVTQGLARVHDDLVAAPSMSPAVASNDDTLFPHPGARSIAVRLDRIADLLDEIGGSPAPGDLLPVKFTGAERRAAHRCQHADVDVGFQFERRQRRLEESDENLTTGMARVLDTLARRQSQGSHSQLILVEGISDSTGSPDENIEYSEARATFLHERLERALRTRPGGAGTEGSGRVIIASYGSGEWASLPPESRIQPPGVLVRVCPLHARTDDPGMRSASALRSREASASMPLPPLGRHD